MPKGKALTNDERREIYEARLLGESREEIARAYGIAPDSVTAIVRRYRQKEDSMAHRECIVAGNKKTGRLVSTADPHRYDGTCVVNGKANSKMFTAEHARAATRMWREWCSELREKHDAQPVAQPVKQPVVPEYEKEVQPVKEVRMENKSDSVYVIWTKGDAPRLFGAYLSMEAALAEVDRLNDVASFLVSEKVFEVEELSLRS